MTAQTVGYKAKAFEPRNLVFFFLLAFGLTWISAVSSRHLRPENACQHYRSSPFPLCFLCPARSIWTHDGCIYNDSDHGRETGVKALWGRFWNRNLSLKWLLVILLFYDVLWLVANLVARTIDGQAYPIVDLPDPIWTIIPLFIQAFISSGMGEEFGWRGYALPRFQAKWNALISSIILGLIWPSWHIQAFFIHWPTTLPKKFLGMGSLDALRVSHLHMDLQQYQRERSCSIPLSCVIQYPCGRIAHRCLALVLLWNFSACGHSHRGDLRPEEPGEAKA